MPSSFTMARRAHAICQGSLYRTLETSPGVSSSSKISEYCLLVGVQLICYENLSAYEEGQYPTASYNVVAMSSSGKDEFRLVTSQGTHLLCSAPTHACREVWVSALTAGLERTLAGTSIGTTTIKKVNPRVQSKRTLRTKFSYCHSCGKLERHEFPLIPQCAPLAQCGEEERVDLCQNCSVAQGVVDHVTFVREMYRAQEVEHVALRTARTMVLKAIEPSLEIDEEHPVPLSGKLKLTKDTYTVVSGVVTSDDFKALQRTSTTIDDLAKEFEQGIIGVMELVDFIEQSVNIRDAEMSDLKKQAFRVAGDMGTALKLLAEQAIPISKSPDGTEQYSSNELLQCILDFFLDLSEEGELQTLAFFWPQLCNIHLQMLPPTDSASLRRIELVEDFLLTIATDHSIHLALELIWHHTADLEDAQTLSYCRKRKYAVLRFLIELESMLFDFSSGWGGGSVTVGKFLAPSNTQIEMLKSSMADVQKYRSKQTEKLSQSCRLNKLQGRRRFDEASVGPEAMATEALRIATNADYLSSHLSFTKRLCDIAEKLRFLQVSKRPSTLKSELVKINSSGAMGGDPLNIVKESLTRVVSIPSTEGHVFRSKERTPVLLLVELNDEGVTEMEPEGAGLNKLFKKEKLKQERRSQDTEESVETETKASDDEGKEMIEVDGGTESTPTETTAESAEAEVTESEGLTATDTSANIDSDAEQASELTPAAGDVPNQAVTPTTNKATLGESILEDPGSYDGLKEGIEKIHALRRFNGQNGEPTILTPSADKEVVEELVTTMVTKLILPSLSEDDEDVKEEKIDSALTPPLKKIANLGGKANTLSKDGDIRREVLNSIMIKGMSEKNTIAAGAATAMQMHLQQLDHRRAVELLMTGDDPQELHSLGISSANKANEKADATPETAAENETMEAVRLLLIQYHVTQGTLSLKDAAKALAPQNLRRKGDFSTRDFMGREFPEIDAGDIDQRLTGCGVLPPAVLQALSLWKGQMITNGELLELVKKDLEFVKVSVPVEEKKDKLNEDSAFWGRFSFGERWAEKRSRIAAKSLEAKKPGYDLTGVIIKSNDDLRQEAFVMQLIELSREAFQEAGLELWLHPYRILPTGRTTGIIEMVRNAMSFDALKKRPGYGKGGLREHLQRMTEFSADPGVAFKSAQRNFVRSLAAYSLLSYLFQFKDRHNGNLLLDTAGHVIHIDFGFVFGVAPGGNFSLEMATPFKLTEEMIDVMDGLRSSLFSEFVTLFCCGFLALQAHCETFVTLVDITCKGSTFKCFEGRESSEVLEKLRYRFCADKGKEETIAFVLDIIKEATSSYGTKQYDFFQYLSQGIAT